MESKAHNLHTTHFPLHHVTFLFPVFPFRRYNYFWTDYGIAEEGPEKSSGLMWLHDTGQTLSMPKKKKSQTYIQNLQLQGK